MTLKAAKLQIEYFQIKYNIVKAYVRKNTHMQHACMFATCFQPLEAIQLAA